MAKFKISDTYNFVTIDQNEKIGYLSHTKPIEFKLPYQDTTYYLKVGIGKKIIKNDIDTVVDHLAFKDINTVHSLVGILSFSIRDRAIKEILKHYRTKAKEQIKEVVAEYITHSETYGEHPNQFKIIPLKYFL